MNMMRNSLQTSDIDYETMISNDKMITMMRKTLQTTDIEKDRDLKGLDDYHDAQQSPNI